MVLSSQDSRGPQRVLCCWAIWSLWIFKTTNQLKLPSWSRPHTKETLLLRTESKLSRMETRGAQEKRSDEVRVRWKRRRCRSGDYIYYPSWKQKRTLKEARKTTPAFPKFFILCENEQQKRITNSHKIFVRKKE